MSKYITTLNRIRAHDPCTNGWRKLLKGLNKTEADDEPLDLLTILNINGLDDALWCMRTMPEHDQEWRLYVVWCARQVQHLMTDQRSIDALDVAERFALGQTTVEELKDAQDAAWAAWAAGAAARAAAGAAARAAAGDAAWTAARAAAGDAAWTAARAAAWTAARAATGDAAWTAAGDARAAAGAAARAAAGDAAGAAARDAAWTAAGAAARAAQEKKLRELLGE